MDLGYDMLSQVSVGGSMNLIFRRSLCTLAVLVLTVGLMITPDIMAQEHVVSSQELRRDIIAAAQVRQENQAKVVEFFSSDQAKGVLRSAGLSYEKIRKAVSQLEDEELIRLASLADRAQHDFAVGALNNQEITYILIALGTAVIILVLVAA
jgi:hypothetical protein